MDTDKPIPVLEIGGSHAAAALVSASCGSYTVTGETRVQLDPADDCGALLGAFLRAANSLPVSGSEVWGVAIPGPFDYRNGVGLFTGDDVGKFGSLNGMNLRADLMNGLPGRPTGVVFLNDADAFGRGECAAGAGRGFDRVVCITLGSGVGSAFLDRGVVIADGPRVPPHGYAYLIQYEGRPLEEWVSRRAIRRGYLAATGVDLDVAEIASRARLGDVPALTVLDDAMYALGRALRPWCDAFSAQALVIGGAIANSWDLIRSPIQTGLASATREASSMRLIRAELGLSSSFVGAALAAADASDAPAAGVAAVRQAGVRG